MESILSSLRAVAESTRLRLLLLCAKGELTVTELTDILGQSQPRVSGCSTGFARGLGSIIGLPRAAGRLSWRGRSAPRYRATMRRWRSIRRGSTR
jgi:hypothetical protein